MGIQLIVDNRYVTIKGASMKTIRKLEKVTSYLVAGFMHSPAFKARRWDGREHLLKFSRKNGFRAPIGLLDDIRECLDDGGVRYDTDYTSHKLLSRRVSFDWNMAIELRPYQKAAKDAICRADRWNHGCGLLKMPIRSGKTKTGAAIIVELGTRTLFITPSQQLLHQTAESLLDSLPGAYVTKIGDGEWDSNGDIVVATIQSLTAARGGVRECKGNVDEKRIAVLMEDSIKKASGGETPVSKKIAKLSEKQEENLLRMLDDRGRKPNRKLLSLIKRHMYGEMDVFTSKPAPCGKKQCRGGHKWKKKPRPEYKELRKNFGLLIFDEAHHLRGDSWHSLVMEIESRYRIGLSATIYLDHDREVERGAIWLKACCGDVAYEVEPSQLIEQGYLMRQNVELVPITKPLGLENRRWSARLQNEAVYLNSYRNAVCALKAREKVKDGMKVLVISRRIAQVNFLCEMIDELGMTVEPVTGKESSRRREELIDGFVGGYTQVLVGTVFGEGLDIPEVEAVINAEGGLDVKSTVQRQRNMTISKGKTRCVFVDMVDLTNEYFAGHSAERKAAYCSEPAYNVSVTRLPKEVEAEADELSNRFQVDLD